MKNMTVGGGKRNAKRRQVQHSVIERAANGFSVKHHLQPKDGGDGPQPYMGAGMPDTQTHVFSGNGAEDAVASHMADALKNGVPPVPDEPQDNTPSGAGGSGMGD